MKLAVVAANGRSGKAFVDAALENGHRVKAGIFGGDSLKLDKDLEVVKCDATKEEDLEKLMKGCDAVLSFIGHSNKSPATVQTDAMKKIVQVTNKLDIKRVISLTGTGVRFPDDKISLLDKVLNFAVQKFDPERVEDGIKHAKVLEKSDLDWTIIRVLKLTDGKAQDFTLRSGGPAKLFTTREEVALACLEVLEESSYIQKAPVICRT